MKRLLFTFLIGSLMLSLSGYSQGHGDGPQGSPKSSGPQDTFKIVSKVPSKVLYGWTSLNYTGVDDSAWYRCPAGQSPDWGGVCVKLDVLTFDVYVIVYTQDDGSNCGYEAFNKNGVSQGGGCAPCNLIPSYASLNRRSSSLVKSSPVKLTKVNRGLAAR